MSTTTRERLERTARIVAGGNCPHAKTFKGTVVYCDKPVDPLTGRHAVEGVYHLGFYDGGRWYTLPLWEDDDEGAFIE